MARLPTLIRTLVVNVSIVKMSQQDSGKDASTGMTNWKSRESMTGSPMEEHLSVRAEDETEVLKSALQKAIRRGQVEKAMYYADRLVRLNAIACWCRLRIIAVEDVGGVAAIAAVETLYRNFLEDGWNTTDKSGPSWDGRRMTITAAKILAELPKDRRADEFIELDAAAEEGNAKARAYLDSLAKYDDWVFDKHTTKGRSIGRGENHWIEVSSQTVDRINQYAKWRERWEQIMKKEDVNKEGGTQK